MCKFASLLPTPTTDYRLWTKVVDKYLQYENWKFHAQIIRVELRVINLETAPVKKQISISTLTTV